MSTDLTTFNFPTTGAVLRTITDEHGDLWAVANDVCAALDLTNPRSSLALLDDDEKGVHSVDTLGGAQLMATVNEPGLYSLILRSRKPDAKAFKRWVTHEVLPQIRKTGQYGTAMAVAPLSYPDALRELAASIEAKEQAQLALAAAQPMVDAWQAFLDSGKDFSADDVAKMLARVHIKTGRDRLLSTLHSWGWTFRAESRFTDRVGPWKAKQPQVECGRLAMMPTWYEHPKTGEWADGDPQVRITVKGAEEIRCRLGGQA